MTHTVGIVFKYPHTRGSQNDTRLCSTVPLPSRNGYDLARGMIKLDLERHGLARGTTKIDLARHDLARGGSGYEL